MLAYREASDQCFELLRHFEKLRLVAYDDATGEVAVKGRIVNGKLTNGYGHTGVDVYIGQEIDEQIAVEWLHKDVAAAEDTVRKLVKVDVSQNQFDALVAFVFNVGRGNFAGSTLLAKLNAEDYGGAAAEFDKWIHSGGKVMDGLVKRRAAEHKLFAGEQWKA